MNKVILMGRLVKDVELKYTTTSNIAVGNFTIAVDRKFTKQGEEKQTDFIPIIVWKQTAEFCSKYFKKGSKILLSGRLQVRTWDDTEGKKHWVTEVVADDVYFADSKKDNDNTVATNNNMQQSSTPTGDLKLDNSDDLPF